MKRVLTSLDKTGREVYKLRKFRQRQALKRRLVGQSRKIASALKEVW